MISTPIIFGKWVLCMTTHHLVISMLSAGTVPQLCKVNTVHQLPGSQLTQPRHSTLLSSLNCSRTETVAVITIVLQQQITIAAVVLKITHSMVINYKKISTICSQVVITAVIVVIKIIAVAQITVTLQAAMTLVKCNNLLKKLLI